MSAIRSTLPGGTRLAALIALAITACLFAWRANTLLHDGLADSEAQTFEQRQLTSLLEPVFGRNNVRLASNSVEDGSRRFLVMVNSASDDVVVDAPTFERMVTILEAAAGYDRATDSLHVQPFEFASGTTGGLHMIDLYELGAISLVGFLLLFTALTPSRGRQELPMPLRQDNDPPLATETRPPPQLRPALVPHKAANEDVGEQARQLARENPHETARILKAWMNQEGEER